MGGTTYVTATLLLVGAWFDGTTPAPGAGQPIAGAMGSAWNCRCPRCARSWSAGQRAGDQPLVVSLAVTHRGIQQRHAQVERAVNDPDRRVVVGRAVALAQPHASQADR
jgi:hypothetical protein